MPNFCVNKNSQSNGDHEVHNLTTGCSYMPDPGNRLHLGEHASCRPAVTEAKKTYSQSNGCFYCAKECNTG